MTRYIEIYEDIKRKIVAGVYEYKSKLPSKRVTADNYHVSVITVEHAYELLIEEGYVITEEKKGYFVSYLENEFLEYDKGSDPLSYVVRRDPRSGRIPYRQGLHSNPEYYHDGEKYDKGTVPLSHETHEELSFNIYAKTVRRVLSEYGEEIKERPHSYGCEVLRRAIADYLLRNRGIKTDYEHILIGSGAEYLYGLIAETFGRDKIYAIEDPSYHKISRVYESQGIVTDKLPLGPDGIESEALWRSDALILHVTPYRSFPTGVTASAAKKAEYISWSRKKGGFIIEDDFESEFSGSRKPEETLFSRDNEGRVIYVNTFSKTIGSFMRTAYMVIPEALSPLFAEKISFHSCSVPALEQYVLADLISNGDFVRHINRVRRKRRMSSSS